MSGDVLLLGVGFFGRGVTNGLLPWTAVRAEEVEALMLAARLEIGNVLLLPEFGESVKDRLQIMAAQAKSESHIVDAFEATFHLLAFILPLQPVHFVESVALYPTVHIVRLRFKNGPYSPDNENLRNNSIGRCKTYGCH